MKPIIKIDHREMQGSLARSLNDSDVEVELVRLNVGDIEIGDRIVIERKSYGDLCRSVIDGRLFKQANLLKSAGPCPILLIEEDREHTENLHSNAIKGALASIAVDLGIPILQSRDSKDTAALIELIANREYKRQQRMMNTIRNRFAKMEEKARAGESTRYAAYQRQGDGKHTLDAEQKCLDEVQEMLVGFERIRVEGNKPISFEPMALAILSSFPGIGPKLSMRLLRHFGNLQNIMNAEEDDLQDAGLSPSRSLQFRRLLMNQSPMTMTLVRN